MWLTSGPGRFTPGKDPGIHLNRRLCEPHNWSGHFGEKISSFYWHSNPGPSSPSPERYTEYATPTAINLRKREMFHWYKAGNKNIILSEQLSPQFQSRSLETQQGTVSNSAERGPLLCTLYFIHTAATDGLRNSSLCYVPYLSYILTLQLVI